VCGGNSHPWLTCLEHKKQVEINDELYEAHKEEEKSSEELLEEISQVCPGCSRYTQKIE
jgi:hypothetical protein